MVALDEYFHHKVAKAPRRCHCGSETAQSEKSLGRRITDVASPRRHRDTSISSPNSCVKFNNRQSVPNSLVSLCHCGENRFRFIDHCSLIFERSADEYGNTLIFTAPGPDGLWFTDDDVQSDYGANDTIYCGYRFDAETQLYYVRNRTYNPTLGRWIQRDPIGITGGINLYGYVNDSPLTDRDSDGRKPLKCGAEAGPAGAYCLPCDKNFCNAYCNTAVGFVVTIPLAKPNLTSVGFSLIQDLELIEIVDDATSGNPLPSGSGQGIPAVGNLIKKIIKSQGYSVWVKVKYLSCDSHRWAERTRYYMLKKNVGNPLGNGVFGGQKGLGRDVTANELRQAIAPAQRNPASCDKGKRPEEYD